MMPKLIEKRDGRQVPFDSEKVRRAVQAAVSQVYAGADAQIKAVTDRVMTFFNQVAFESDTVTVEGVQDKVEGCIQQAGYFEVAKRYILYRNARTRAREMRSDMSKTMMDLTFTDAVDSDIQRENANIDADSAMGTMLKYGSENAKKFYLDNLITPEIADAHRNGDIHIHDLDFYALTETCCQIDMGALFERGFHSGHGYVRTPRSIGAYAALACIIIQSNQNDMHGGQSIPNWEYDLAPGVSKTFRAELAKCAEDVALALDVDFDSQALDVLDKAIAGHESVLTEEARQKAVEALAPLGAAASRVFDTARRRTVKATFQAMEAVIHNLNMMQSRAGSQVPFSSINLGTGTSPEQRIVIETFLKALDAGLGHGETSIFPVVIFRVLDGVNGRPGDPNYDLFRLACKVSADRMFPNFEFLDAPFNKAFIKGDDPNTYVATMGCRTRVMANIHGEQTTPGRGNLSFTTINLPRLGMKAGGNVDVFFSSLDAMLDLVARQLIERFEVQARRHVRNYPFLMGQGIWRDSENLGDGDEVRDVLKHGTLTIGFIGLAECLTALVGRHHGESQDARDLGYAIIKHMREACDGFTRRYQMNFSLIGTPAEGLAGRFVARDKVVFGVRKGVTDREYYTNSFHIPVWFPCTMKDKITWEAPFHELCNGGHICYVELDGDVSCNPEAVEDIVQFMKRKNVGYGSINHAVDFDPVCGYRGVIGDRCPRCGRREDDPIPGRKSDEEFVSFQRIRRITGYLVGDVRRRFNNAKRAEEHDRVKHGRA